MADNTVIMRCFYILEERRHEHLIPPSQVYFPRRYGRSPSIYGSIDLEQPSGYFSIFLFQELFYSWVLCWTLVMN